MKKTVVCCLALLTGFVACKKLLLTPEKTVDYASATYTEAADYVLNNVTKAQEGNVYLVEYATEDEHRNVCAIQILHVNGRNVSFGVTDALKGHLNSNNHVQVTAYNSEYTRDTEIEPHPNGLIPAKVNMIASDVEQKYCSIYPGVSLILRDYDLTGVKIGDVFVFKGENGGQAYCAYVNEVVKSKEGSDCISTINSIVGPPRKPAYGTGNGARQENVDARYTYGSKLGMRDSTVNHLVYQ